ncbi:MAG: hypothetical protein U1A04_00865 [Moraxellaceae bacterium]|nr:hypothetical protein [Moraxellaceae bacterium]
MVFRFSIFALLATALLSTGCASGRLSQPLDKRLVGNWEGLREEGSGCQFLAWKSAFRTDGSFEIIFFRDKARTQQIQTERGVWTAANGRSELKTEGVGQPEVYLYTFQGPDAVHYENTAKDPSADCQADYQFTERRVAQ